MALDYYIHSGGKRLRCGFTTGTCAALAAAGAAAGLLTGELPDHMSLVTPAGVSVEVPLVRVKSGASSVCGVRKDAGDDRDATDGILIVAEAFRGKDEKSENTIASCGNDGGSDDTEGSLGKGSRSADIKDFGGIRVQIEGGPGVGRVTKPGLDQPVGAAAINSTPRRMIEDAVRKVCESTGYEGTVCICISVPDGEKIAEKTFNGHLGIEGGISILGTSGIVKPMSMQAYIDAVNIEIRQQAAMGKKRLILTPGNYGKNFLHELREGAFPVPGMQDAGVQGGEKNLCGPVSYASRTADSGSVEELLRDASVPVVMCSNFIGDALDSAAMYGFDEMLLVGHIGKMVKLAGGIMNTHSMYADCRTELFCAHAAVCGARTEVCREIMSAATTDACLGILEREGIRETVMDSLMTAVCGHISRRVCGSDSRKASRKCRIHVLVFSNIYGILGIRTVFPDTLDTEKSCDTMN
ncbi:MAG: cobalt-precorrin-5B (C(1))-methyltransferase CbiD [Eubacteriales bacterium]